MIGIHEARAFGRTDPCPLAARVWLCSHPWIIEDKQISVAMVGKLLSTLQSRYVILIIVALYRDCQRVKP